MGRTDEAIADLEKALQLQPGHADAHTCLGNAFLRKNLLNEAVANTNRLPIWLPRIHIRAIIWRGYWPHLPILQSATEQKRLMWLRRQSRSPAGENLNLFARSPLLTRRLIDLARLSSRRSGRFSRPRCRG